MLGLNNPSTALTTYNLACLQLRKGECCRSLAPAPRSVDHGLPRWVVKGMAKDPDLKPFKATRNSAPCLPTRPPPSCPGKVEIRVKNTAKTRQNSPEFTPEVRNFPDISRQKVRQN